MKPKAIINKIQKIILDILFNKIEIERQNKNIVIDIPICFQGDYNSSIYIKFSKTYENENSEAQQRTIWWAIDEKGNFDDNASKSTIFKDLADRIHFFNNLHEVEL